jgi:hypothetical protein
MKRSSALYVALLIALALTIASLPYIAGMAMAGGGVTYTGLTWNIDDACVYLSWIRQVADGHIFYWNNYTNEHQQSLQFNLLFAAMGGVVRLTGLSPTAVFHIFRLLLGAGLLVMAWRLARMFIPDDRKRMLFLAILAFSSGFGWFLPEQGHQGPVDTWQPEAITFLSLYLNPLFLAGLILMLASLYFLMLARTTERVKPAIAAGVMLLLLANIHSYDVAIVGGVWAAYLAVSCIVERRVLWTPIMLSALAAAIALPALGYQFYLYTTEEVFRLRANTPAPSPTLWSYFLGYGAVFVAAVFGIRRSLRGRKHLLLPVWMVMGFLLPYLPFAQQRKFIMGLHIPLAILAVMAIWPLLSRLSWRNARALAAAVVAFAAIGNIYFLQRDMGWLQQNRTATIHRPFLLDSEINALEWLRANTERSDTVFASPDIAIFVPAIAGNNVYYGHWSETPDYDRKIREWLLFARPDTPAEVRRAILENSGAEYVMQTIVPAVDDFADLSDEPYLAAVFRDGSTAIYRTAQ